MAMASRSGTNMYDVNESQEGTATDSLGREDLRLPRHVHTSEGQGQKSVVICSEGERSANYNYVATTSFRSTAMRIRDSMAIHAGKVGQDGPPQQPKSVFVDAASMKEKMRQQLSKPDYNVANFYHTEGFFQFVARSIWFERLSLFVITFNAVWISIDTDLNDADVLIDATWPFQLADNFFCSFFLVEISVRFLAFKCKSDGFRDAWFVFDFIMVITMIMETWVMTLVMLVIGAGDGGLGNAGILKLIRLTRLSRMARMARLFRAMPELLVLLKGMWAATRSVFFTLFLLFIIIYIFGVAFKQLADGTSAGETHFNNVPASMHTLLLRGTLMDEMTDIVDELFDSSAFFVLVFYVFVLVSALTVMNMLIGVLCEVVAAVAATEKEEASVAYVKWKIRDVMSQGGIDLDGDGRISKEEFCQILDNPQATRTLSSAGVDVFGLVDCADFIFGSCSPFATNEDNGEIFLNFPDFMEVVLQLRGTNVTTVKDMVDLRKFLTVSCQRIEEKVETLAKFTEELTKSVCSKASINAEESHPTIQCGTLAKRPPPEKQNNVKRETRVDEAVCIETPCSQIAPLLLHNSIRQTGAAFSDSGTLGHLCSDLDQLRSYVDTELVAIMHDLRHSVDSLHLGDSKEEGIMPGKPSTRCSSGGQAHEREDDAGLWQADLKSHLNEQEHKHLASWEQGALMCPGAELRRPIYCGL